MILSSHLLISKIISNINFINFVKFENLDENVVKIERPYHTNFTSFKSRGYCSS